MLPCAPEAQSLSGSLLAQSITVENCVLFLHSHGENNAYCGLQNIIKVLDIVLRVQGLVTLSKCDATVPACETLMQKAAVVLGHSPGILVPFALPKLPQLGFRVGH